MKIFVAGGGISGLTLSHHLMVAGHDVTCFEPSERPGGVMRTERRSGFLCEVGPQGILDGSPETRALIDDLGLVDEIVRPAPSARRRLVFVRGRLRTVPQDPLSLLSSDLLSASGKLRLLREPFVKPRTDGEDESLLDFGVRRLGAEAARHLVAPAAIGVFAGDAANLSLRSTFPRLAALEARHGSLLKGLRAARREGSAPGRMFSFREGLEQLPRALARRLGPRLVRTEISSIAHDTTGWQVNNTGARAAALVLATSPPVTAALLDGPEPEAAALLRQVHLAPVVVLWLGFARAQIGMNLDAYGFLVARGEGPALLGCQFESSVFPGRAPAGGALLRVMLGGAFEPDIIRLGDDALIERTCHELQMIAGLEARPDFTGVWRHPAAIPQYQVGHERRALDIEAAVGRHPGLHVIGTALRGVGANDCIRNAVALAKTFGQA